jgi:DNA-binding transcriptional LysR family regulator
MNRIADLEAFVSVVDSGSLTAAARHLRRSLQSVSRSLAAVEQDVGVELVRRTTRQTHPTEAGLVLHERLRMVLAEIAEARSLATRGRVEPEGLLRVGAPGRAGTSLILPAIAEFLAAHPKVQIDLHQHDFFSDPLDERLDVTIRVGRSPDSALMARHLADWRRVFVAAPSYLARHGRPRRPDDLGRHECIVRAARPGAHVWPYTSARGTSGKATVGTIEVGGRFRGSATYSSVDAALLGLGIAIVPQWQAEPYLRNGALERVLRRYEPPSIPVSAVWTATPALPAKTRLFIDFLAWRLKKAR